LTGSPQLHILEPNLDNMLITDLNRAILGKQRHLCCCPSILKHLDGLTPNLLLRIVNFSKIEHLSLDNPPAGYPPVLHNVPVTVFFSILLASRAA
jgi:hypothetical protein